MCLFASLGAASLVVFNATAQTPAPTTTATAAPAATDTAPVRLPYGVEDILKLSHAQVSEDDTLNFIHNSGAIYNLSPSDIVYLRNQGVSDRVNYFVSIEGGHLIDPARTLRTLAYEHPLFDLAAAQAQPAIAGLNANARGRTETYFAGAWQRYGFHEDGLLSAVNLATLLLGRDPWASAGVAKENA